MSKLYLLNLFVAVCLMSLTGCSDNDEPKAEEHKFGTLEEICGARTWVSEDITFFASTGQEINIERVLESNVGAYLSLNFSVDGNTLTRYYQPDGYHWASSTDTYTFDRDNGYIYLKDPSKPFARIISVEADRIVLHTHFGEYVDKSMIEGNDSKDGTPDEGNYAVIVLSPTDEAPFPPDAEWMWP